MQCLPALSLASVWSRLASSRTASHQYQNEKGVVPLEDQVHNSDRE